MIPHLLLQKGEKLYLLLCGGTQFHIITADRRLTEEAENWLLAAERSIQSMNERQLSRQTIEKTDLRGVAVGGKNAGSVIQFYLKDKKHRYTLSDDYSQEELDSVFDGIQKFTPPKMKNTNEDWRVQHQDPKLMKKLRAVGGFLNFTGCTCGFVLMFLDFRFAWLNWLTLLIAVSAFALWLAFPHYFTVIERKKDSPEKKQVIEIMLALIMPALGFWLAVLRSIAVLNWVKPWILGAIATALLTLVVWKRMQELRSLGRIICFAAACFVLVAGLLLGINRLVDFRPNQTVNQQVIELEVHESSRSRDSYYVHVQLEDGKIAELPVRASYFKTLQVGDWVKVTIHEGALGISYAMITE